MRKCKVISGVQCHSFKIAMMSSGHSTGQGALAGETKRRIFQIPCEMQRGLNLLRPDYIKWRSKRERDHSFAVWHHSTTKRKWRQGA